MNQKTISTLLLAVGALAPAVLAEPVLRWQRPADAATAAQHRTTYQAFDLFSDDDSDPSNGIQDLEPDVANINPNGNAAVTERSGGAFLTGTGNIYSPFAVLDMNVSVPGYAPRPDTITRFVVRIDTLGSELVRTDPAALYDFSAFAINGSPLAGLTEFAYTELSREGGSGPAGQTSATVSHAFEFAFRSATASNFDFSYMPLETSCSQAYIAVDSFSTILGDFDFDGDRDAADIDLLLRAPAGVNTAQSSLFDLNEDGQVKPKADLAGSDADLWVRGLEATEYGDANLDGRVNFDDLLTLAQNYGTPASSWALGDFDGSDAVNFDDLLTLAQHYGSPASFNTDWALARSLVPEPATLGVAIGLGILATRRRRHQETRP